MKAWLGYRSAVLVALIWMFTLAPLAHQFPPVNADEAFLANHAYNLVRGHVNRYSLYDDLFEPELKKYREAQAGLLQIVYEAWIGPFVGWVHKSLWMGRVSSLLAGFLCLLIFYHIGCQEDGPVGGWLCMLLVATHPLFLLSASLIRAEIILLMAFGGLLALIPMIPEHHQWKYPLLGWLFGLLCGIHQNSVALFAGALVYCLLRKSSQGRLVRLVFMTLSYLVGVVTIFSLIDLPSFVLSLRSGIFGLYKPPILRWPWTPWGCMVSWIQIALSGKPTWYLRGQTGPLWSLCLSVYWAGTLALLLVASCKSASRHALWPWLGGMICSLMAWGALISKPETLYTVLFLAFWAPLVSQMLVFSSDSPLSRWIRMALGAVLVSSSGLYFVFRQQYLQQVRPYDDVVAQLHTQILPEDKVAAPCVLWFAWPEDKFRDISALVGSRWLTGGRRDVARWLGGWKPDIVVIESSWKRMLLGQGDTGSLLQKALPIPVHAITTIDTGPGSEGVWEVFRLDWKNTRH
jgi:hypothetical protein